MKIFKCCGYGCVCQMFLTCHVGCRSVDNRSVVFLCRSPCRHGQRLPEPAVWFQSLLPLWRVIQQNDAILKCLLLIALYSGNTICCILCHLKIFLDETVILLQIFRSIFHGNNAV